MATQQNFRTAFNGFNREDVVHYIEYMNTQHAAEIAQLNSELEFFRSKPEIQAEASALEEQAARIDELTSRCAGLEAELEALRAEKAELETQLGEAMDAGIEIEKQLNDALDEKALLASDLEAAKNQQTAFESRKNEELEAYRRAERAERMAQERANQMYQKANGIIADATCKVTDAADQLGHLSESVMEQLEQLRAAVSGSNQALKDAAACMSAIRPEEE
ncbi:MAG: hypothetical protein IKJ99_09110 [Oscillospiraceae bacterium]|nr:hypothetical protein [Oscillospiraceae bacterium]